MKRYVLFFFGVWVVLCASAWAESAALSDSTAIVISVSRQQLYLYKNGKFDRKYPVSTSKLGIGSLQNSQKTPLGRHFIAKKIGAGAPSGMIFKNRISTGKTARINKTVRPSGEDHVTSRILWLKGLEPGKNQGGRVDSYHRFIYIHGTPDEGLIGRPASHGCVRMTNADVIDLFDRAPRGAAVEIVA